MPSKTEKQRIAIAIALHEPGKLYKRNRSMLKMNKEQLHDFAVRSEKSTKGSPSFTVSELSQGYRKIEE